MTLEPLSSAPRDGSRFHAILVEDDRFVVISFSTDYHWWLGEERWLDDNSDGDKYYEADEIQGWIP